MSAITIRIPIPQRPIGRFRTEFNPAESLAAQILIEKFIENAATNFGLCGKVHLILVDKPDVIECNTIFKRIYLSRDLAKNFGTPDNLVDQSIDNLPNNPLQLHKILNDAIPEFSILCNREVINLTSGLEIEAFILHEIGHIYCNHLLPPFATTALKHLYEFTADSFAYSNDRGRLGFTRFHKRKIIGSFLSRGNEIIYKIPFFNGVEDNSNHPSDEERLQMVFLYEKNLGLA